MMMPIPTPNALNPKTRSDHQLKFDDDRVGACKFLTVAGRSAAATPKARHLSGDVFFLELFNFAAPHWATEAQPLLRR